jgi:hypothetical protein
VSAEFEQLVAEFERFQSKITTVDDRSANIGEMRAELTHLQATAISPDRAISVTAGPGGSILAIDFTEDAVRQPARALSAAVMATLQQAVAESARRQAAIVEEHMGDGMHIVDQVLETQAELFGTTVEDLRSKMTSPVAGEPAQESAEDFSEQSFLTDTDSTPQQAPAPSQGDEFLKNLFDEEDR